MNQANNEGVLFIVDNNKEDRNLTGLILEEIDPDFSFREFDSGEEVLQYFDALEGSTVFQEPDLILMDITMPGKDGFSTLSELRQRPGSSHIPVILQSNLCDFEYVSRGIQIGAHAVVPKFQKLQIMNQIQNIFFNLAPTA